MGSKKNLHGLFPRNYNQSARWRVDCDYADKLSHADKEWLSKFLDEQYGGTFGDDPFASTEGEQRALWKEQSRWRADSATNCSRTDVDAGGESGDAVAWTEEPSFTQQPAYIALHAKIKLLAREIMDLRENQGGPGAVGGSLAALEAEHREATKALIKMNKTGTRGTSPGDAWDW